MITAVRETIKTLVDFEAATTHKEISVAHAPAVSVAPLTAVNRASTMRATAFRLFPVRIDMLYVFTKRLNPNKLYLDSNTGIFLSAGIVLRFMKQDGSKLLKKRLKV